MGTGTGTEAARTVPVRVGALLVAGGRVCLIRRRRGGGEQDTVPGGLVGAGEGERAALLRELREELGLVLAAGVLAPVPHFEQEQATVRPVDGRVFRRRHLLWAVDLPPDAADRTSAVELDDPGGTEVVWLPVPRARGVHLYPDVGAVLGATPGPGTRRLPPVGDSYRWR
ncbi:NUDIX domain-containing protein [Kitasatospora sp. NPDC088391]|uniref:NUDIX domain-containing protein n=1 Tax=Kitasatospora sp. NPDC088391 TaxID=3364074 RepID=UPI00380A7E66